MPRIAAGVLVQGGDKRFTRGGAGVISDRAVAAARRELRWKAVNGSQTHTCNAVHTRVSLFTRSTQVFVLVREPPVPSVGAHADGEVAAPCRA